MDNYIKREIKIGPVSIVTLSDRTGGNPYIQDVKK